MLLAPAGIVPAGRQVYPIKLRNGRMYVEASVILTRPVSVNLWRSIPMTERSFSKFHNGNWRIVQFPKHINNVIGFVVNRAEIE